jgi:hypothetical protein
MNLMKSVACVVVRGRPKPKKPRQTVVRVAMHGVNGLRMVWAGISAAQSFCRQLNRHDCVIAMP